MSTLLLTAPDVLLPQASSTPFRWCLPITVLPLFLPLFLLLLLQRLWLLLLLNICKVGVL
jgi:hypothetical protein